MGGASVGLPLVKMAMILLQMLCINHYFSVRLAVSPGSWLIDYSMGPNFLIPYFQNTTRKEVGEEQVEYLALT